MLDRSKLKSRVCVNTYCASSRDQKKPRLLVCSWPSPFSLVIPSWLFILHRRFFLGVDACSMSSVRLSMSSELQVRRPLLLMTVRRGVLSWKNEAHAVTRGHMWTQTFCTAGVLPWAKRTTLSHWPMCWCPLCSLGPQRSSRCHTTVWSWEWSRNQNRKNAVPQQHGKKKKKI